MSELKPCPFCGGEAILESNKLRYGTIYSAYCQKCGAEITGFSEHEAVAAWNRRAQPDDLLTSTRRAQHMATVDTVEVVRCRDCVHFGECLVTENDYCSKGERKENY